MTKNKFLKLAKKHQQGEGSEREKNILFSFCDKAQFKDLVYNTLAVPYGKRFELELSDGTTVYLNAGTPIKYSVKFFKETISIL